MGRDELFNVCTPKEGTTVEETVEGIWETRKEVISYLAFKGAKELGITFGLNDIPFEKAMIFSWIKGEIDGRKT